MPLTDDRVRAELADFLTEQEPMVTQQWLELVNSAADIDHARTLPRSALIDHLPDVYSEMCDWVRRDQRNHLTREAKQDAQAHGTERWSAGFRIDELLRELDLFRAVVLSSTLGLFRSRCSAFTPEIEVAFRFAIEEYFSRVSSLSLQRYVAENQTTIADYVARLEQRNRALQVAASQRQRLTSVLAHELRNFVQGLSAVIQRWDLEPTSASARTHVKAQVSDLYDLLQRLVEHSSVIGGSAPLHIESFDPRQLCDELLASYSSAAQAKHLSLHLDCKSAPHSVTSDRLKIKQIAVNLLANAIRYTQSGAVSLVVEEIDSAHWRIVVIDTGPGLEQTKAARLLNGLGDDEDPLPGRGIGLGITKDLIELLDGTIEWQSSPGKGSRFSVTLASEFHPKDA